MSRGYSDAHRDAANCNTHDYGDASYWDKRYRQDPGPFDWYQHYSGLASLIEKYIPKLSRILMVGCGNAVMSEDMVKEGYQEIINIDISSVVIDSMQKKYQNVPQLKYSRMDVRDLSFFDDCTFDSVIDKGTLDSIMCGTNASFSASSMLAEINRVLKPGGVYMLITYGDPSVRMPSLNVPKFNWRIMLYVIPRPGSEDFGISPKSLAGPVPLNGDGSYAEPFMVEDPDSYYAYVCIKAIM